MPVASENPPKTTRRLVLIALAAALLLVIAYFACVEPDPGQEACMAAHAAERGISRQQLTSELRYQEDLVAILSSCSGMAP